MLTITVDRTNPTSSIKMAGTKKTILIDFVQLLCMVRGSLQENFGDEDGHLFLSLVDVSKDLGPADLAVNQEISLEEIKENEKN